MVLRCAVDQLNRWAFRCRVNVNRERVVVRRAAGKLFQMNGPATVKLLISAWSLFLVLTASRCQRTVGVACQQWQRLPDSRPPSMSAPIRTGTCKLLVRDSMPVKFTKHRRDVALVE